jgi:polyisoprenoid-binding protein YceI
LTPRGVIKPIVLDAILNGTMQPNALFKTPEFGVSASAHIKRSEWGMSYGTQFVGDDVELLIQAEYRPVG